MGRAILNPRRRPDARRVTARATAFHRRLPGYRPGPLRPLPSLAAELGLAATHLKDESERYGLPAFKILGASWATYRLLCRRLGHEPGDWATIAGLRQAFAPLQPLTLVTATDGNHGRAVARAAAWFGLSARILVPAGTSLPRIEAIQSEGATVDVVDGSYDDAVDHARALAGDRSIVVSDTSWPGYDEIPGWVSEGYQTICTEADQAFDAAREQGPTHVFVQVGVGSLAVAIIRHYAPRAKVIGLEPEAAACCFESILAGEPVSVPGPHTSIMAGMNCGTLSTIAWPELRDGLDAVITLDDEPVREAMRRLAAGAIISGETGASGLAAVAELMQNPAHTAVRQALGMGPASRVLALSTEGATDPGHYQRIVGRPAEAVLRG